MIEKYNGRVLSRIYLERYFYTDIDELISLELIDGNYKNLIFKPDFVIFIYDDYRESDKLQCYYDNDYGIYYYYKLINI